MISFLENQIHNTTIRHFFRLTVIKPYFPGFVIFFFISDGYSWIFCFPLINSYSYRKSTWIYYVDRLLLSSCLWLWKDWSTVIHRRRLK